MKTHHLMSFFLLFLAAMVVSACAKPVKVTGGGWIPSSYCDEYYCSSNPKQKANFGFNGASCDPDNISGHFNFHDKSDPYYGSYGGVKINGTVKHVGICEDLFGGELIVSACNPEGFGPFYCPEHRIGIDVWYDSTNPKKPGTGFAVVCVKDKGEGADSDPDKFQIKILTGPFRGYFNKGPVQGNIQEHSCPCRDGYDNDLDGLSDYDDPGCKTPDGINGEEVDL